MDISKKINIPFYRCIIIFKLFLIIISETRQIINWSFLNSDNKYTQRMNCINLLLKHLPCLISRSCTLNILTLQSLK